MHASKLVNGENNMAKTNNILLSCLILLLNVELSCLNSLPKCNERQYTTHGVCCNKCRPGYRILTHCTSSEHPESSCVPCDRNWYMDKWNGADYCKAMNMCNKSHEVIHKAASNDGTEDNVCKCEKSYHYTDTHEFCLQNADCPPGQGSKNGLCVVCVDGTYSDVTSNTKKCKKQPDCEATGMQVIKEGNSTTPTICGLAPKQPTDAPRTFTSASTDALPTTENVISSDRSTPVIATPAPQPGAITGSGDSVWETMRGMLIIGGVLIIILVPIGVCKLRKKKQHSRNIENAETSGNVNEDGQDEGIATGTTTSRRTSVESRRQSMVSGEASSGVFDSSCEEIPMENTQLISPQHGREECIPMTDNHVQLLRDKKPLFAKDLPCVQVMERMSKFFSEEDESTLSVPSLSKFERNRKLIDILITKEDAAFYEFIHVLHAIGCTHLADALTVPQKEEEQPMRVM